MKKQKNFKYKTIQVKVENPTEKFERILRKSLKEAKDVNTFEEAKGWARRWSFLVVRKFYKSFEKWRLSHPKNRVLGAWNKEVSRISSIRLILPYLI